MRGGMGNTDIHGPWAQGYNSRFGISLTDTMSKNIIGLTYNNNTARIIQTAH